MTIVVRSACAFVSLLTIGLATPAATQPRPPTGRPDDPALARASEAVVAEPRKAARWMDLARTHYKAGHLPPALDAAKRALELEPARRDARLLVGECFVTMARYEEAIEQLESVEAEYADDRAFAYVLGTAYIETDRADDGQRLIDSLAKGGDSARLHVLRARARLRADDPLSALAELKQAHALEPRLPMVHALMGRALLSTGDETGALAAFRKELAINPSDFDANLQIGEARIRARQFEAARASIKRAMEMRRHDVAARFAMARVYLATGQPDEARVMLQWVMKDDPTHAEASALLATLLATLPRPLNAKP